jgi:hypothetical protein
LKTPLLEHISLTTNRTDQTGWRIKWCQRPSPLYRGTCAGLALLSCIFMATENAPPATLMVEQIALVAQPRPSPTSLTPEQIACNFLSISNVTKCRSTVRFDSYFDGDVTTGSTIPSEIALLSRLMYLDVAYNQLTGTIPSEMGLMHQLTNLSFYNNQLTGTIPSEIGELTQLTFLDFYSNSLTGTIPSEMGLLTQLELLYFARNDLSGTMLSSLCSLPSLTDYIFIDCGEIACASGCCWSGDTYDSCG